jgi:hypothetical protein
MIGLQKMAEMHRDQFYQVLLEAGTDIVVRPAAAPTALPNNDVTKALGVRTQVLAYGTPITVRAVLSGPTTGNTINPASAPIKVNALGTVQMSEVILRLKVDDCLLDPDKPYGKTIFDNAKDVLIGDRPFKVIASERSGLAPLSPYILWVGLEHMGS